jgi:integrase
VKRRKRRRGSKLKGFRFDERRGIARFSVYLPGGGGLERVRGTAKAATLDEALTKFAEFRARALRERPVEVPTLRDYVRTYFEDMTAGVSEVTAKGYAEVIRNHIVPAFGEQRLDRIDTPLVKAFETKLKKAGYALASVNGFIDILLMLLRRAVDEFGVIDSFPLKRALKRKKPPLLALELTDDERQRFFVAFDDEAAFRQDLADRRVVGEVARSEHYAMPRRFGGSMRPDGDAAADAFERFRYVKPLFVVAIETGLRRGDLLRLSWRDIDFEQGWVRLVMQKTKLVVTVPLSAACREALGECKRRAGRHANVFIDEEGRQIMETRLKRAFERAKRLARITRRFRFHDMRHTFASRLASRNVSIPIISKALGHASITMTMRYARPSLESLRSIQAALDE